MAELAVASLIKRGVSQIQVINRTLEKAQELAHRWAGQAATFESLSDLLRETDILISSTGAPHTVIFPAMVAPALENRSGRPLVIMDIAVPRDVDQGVAEISGVSLFDMDALSQGLEQSLKKREAEIPKVEAIIEEEKAEFMDFLATLDVVPVIVKMRQQANTIRKAELEKALRRLSGLSPGDQQQIEALTKSIVHKILHSPTVRLREEAGGPNAADYADITRGLFGLD